MSGCGRSLVFKGFAALLFFCVCGTTYAQDVFAQIAKHQERLEKINSELSTSMSRIIASGIPTPEQNRAYELLNNVEYQIRAASREFQVLTHSLVLASMVTDKRMLPLAKRSVEIQKDYMVNQMQGTVTYLEKILHHTDQETTRLLLESRDALRVSIDFVNRLKAPESKGSLSK